MHFCLISAPTITEFRSQAELRNRVVLDAAREPQLGVLAVAATLERMGNSPSFIDANSAYLQFALAATCSDVDGFAEHLAAQAVRSNADVYGLSTICSTYPLTLRIAKAIKRLRPYSMILLGGPQASVVDVPTMENFPWIDFILRGESEQSLPMLVAQLEGDYQYERVPGLTFREGTSLGASAFGAMGTFGGGSPRGCSGRVVRTANAPVIEDLDALPAPAYHLSSYLEQGAKTAVIELGRGCPFACTFCSTNDFFRRRFRLRSPEKVLGEMRSVHATYGVRDFDLVHDMFTVDRKRVVKFCEAMAAGGEGFTWSCSARTDCVDKALLEQMAASGCTGVFFGIESGSVRMQRIIDKDLDPERAEHMITAAERYGMRSTASLITGFPEENWDDLRDTLRIFTHAARCSRSHPQLNLLAPLAGTPIHMQHAHEMQLEELCSDMSHQGLNQSPEDLELIKAFPQIFPNFYMVPAPDLDREVLFELRQFLTLMLELFRPYLCLIAQLTDLLNFHAEWREWRESERGALSGSALRLYYVDGRFQRDFPRFLRSHAVAEDLSVRALLDVDEAMTTAKQVITIPQQPDRTFVQAEQELHSADHVCLPEGCSVLLLPLEVTALHEAIARKAIAIERQTCYATRRNDAGMPELREITPVLAELLRVCDGATVGSTLNSYAASLVANTAMGAIHAIGAEEFARELLAGAHKAGWVQVTRDAAAPTPARIAHTQLAAGLASARGVAAGQFA